MTYDIKNSISWHPYPEGHVASDDSPKIDQIDQQPISPGLSLQLTEIGRKLPGFLASPPLCTGVTFDRFHAKGTVPVFREWL